MIVRKCTICGAIYFIHLTTFGILNMGGYRCGCPEPFNIPDLMKVIVSTPPKNGWPKDKSKYIEHEVGERYLVIFDQETVDEKDKTRETKWEAESKGA